MPFSYDIYAFVETPMIIAISLLERNVVIFRVVAEGGNKVCYLTRALVTLFMDLGYLVPQLEGARFDTRRYMKGTWRCTRSCTSTAPAHHFRISQYPKRLPPILKMNFFSDKELRAL